MPVRVLISCLQRSAGPGRTRSRLPRMIAVLALALVTVVPAWAQTVSDTDEPWSIEAPQVALRDVGFKVSVQIHDHELGLDGYAVETESGSWPVIVDPEDEIALIAEGVVLADEDTSMRLVRNGTVVAEASTRTMPGWPSILPPLLAIVIALIFKRVVPSLFLGIWFGAMLAVGITFEGAFRGLMNTFQIYVLNALVDADHASIILFSFMIGGMVGIISRNGGMQGVVNRITGWARSPRRGQVATSFLGIAIFFDDYANTLVVGNTMRSVTDRLKVSREKLAYLVDSTAAPVACLALVTTWIGFEVGLIGQAVDKLPRLNLSAYSVFLSSIPYSFYPLLAIFFVFMVAVSRRDFGPMYKAEVRARSTGKVLGDDARVDEAAIESKETTPKEGKPHRMINAIVPVVVLVGGVLVSLYITGRDSDPETQQNLREIIGDAASYKALMWGSLLGVVTAALMSIGQRILTIDEVVESWYAGLKAMLFAMIILVLAWSLSEITEVLHTAEYLTTILGDALNPGFVPAIVFILSAATAFATGSSWGTMGILMPLVFPLAWAVLLANEMGDPEHYHILYSTVSCVLAGAVWGDHCSPISDTTILSSMASGCDHIEHVRTQLPYALTVGGVAVLVGTIPAGFGFPWYVSLVIGGAFLYGVLHFFGKRADDVVAAG
ncbi:MAG: Na+/H+ antiporter NhaC family protein [Rhodothermales bacterium]|nr:Na+/H+ antiporter NhaC family protein [Rhodothermales bacterium]